MKIDAPAGTDLKSIGEAATRTESLGYDGIRVAETNHEPFMPLTLAAAATETLELVTSVAVAFARSPMVLAQQAHDLNAFSGGRLVLGIGSQVKPHIERRFNMPWHKAAAQMREYINAMHAIYDCWYDGARLEFFGDYYQFSLMPSTFTPENTSGPRPRIALSATGPLMTKVAAETADGMIMHPFSSDRYMREVTLPAIEAGLATRGKSLAEFQLDYAPMLATGETEEALQAAIDQVRDRIAFYGCTVAYRPVLELHGWGALQDELIALNKAHRKADMAALIDDEILHTIAIVGEPGTVVDEMQRRLGGIIHRTGFGGVRLSEATLADMLGRLRTAS
ncbi:MAG: TIGR03617 family F420-dependent LLM class oxidoreductase [Pseudomonadota bacterium]